MFEKDCAYEVMKDGARLVGSEAQGSGIGTSWRQKSFKLFKGAIIHFEGRGKSIFSGSVEMPFFSIESSGFGAEAGSDMGGVVYFKGFFEPNSWGCVPEGYLEKLED